MFGLGTHGPDGKYALILDVGSASVGAAIVVSDTVTDENPIVFSHREWAVIKDASVENPTRFIEEAVLRLFLVLGSEGISTLQTYDARARITHIQVAVSAPWAHTITQQAEYENDKTFKITDKLLESLVDSAQKSSIESIDTTEFLKREGLEVITSQTLHVTANGYTIADPRGLEAARLYVSHSSGIASVQIIETVREHCEKVFPRAKLYLNTFMLSYYAVLRDLFPNTTEMTLIDITGEATEVGVVRNNELTKVSHSLIGIQTIARILSDKLKMPLGATKPLLQDEAPSLTEKQQIIAESVYEEYVDEIANLFRTMGDVLTVPGVLYLHTDRYTEAFFKKYVQKAAERATGGTITVIPITKQLFPKTDTNDTAILLSAYLFHKLHKHGTIAK